MMSRILVEIGVRTYQDAGLRGLVELPCDVSMEFSEYNLEARMRCL